ncbi:MAG: hypothetical protein Q8Q54_17505 [Methylococcales bacterium]|jgi:hypothetical protein|nr:hypothetical protein [Methylococcales bacterium]MDP3010515.1 hypothetical protein [Methylococcales bacterium]MDP3840715.1 hypothetical protein [Methylococcales bacterium]
MNTQKDNVATPLFIIEKREIVLEDSKALYAVTRQAEQILQALKTQKESQSDAKPKESNA